MNQIDKLAWLCVKDKQLLLARSRDKDIYYIPGGKREIGESDQAALIREIREELSIDLVPDTIQYAGTFAAAAHDKSDGTLVKLTCYFAEFTGKIQADAEIEEVLWLNHRDKAKGSAATIRVMDWLKSENIIN
jgi:8-oxo-dGTP diphosphatase